MDRHLALQCFCRVVETGGFAAAARDLDYSPSMVTKYIQHLEEWTGSRLLARTTRRMQLTEAGELAGSPAGADQASLLIEDEEGGVRGRVVVVEQLE